MPSVSRRSAGMGPEASRKGLAIVEMALITPLLFLLVFGVLEYGWLFLKMHQITSAARHGARIACTPDSTNAQVQAAISLMMVDAGLDGSGYVVSFSPGDISVLGRGATFQVSVTVPYGGIALTGPFVPVPATIRGTTSMAKEGP